MKPLPRQHTHRTLQFSSDREAGMWEGCSQTLVSSLSGHAHGCPTSPQDFQHWGLCSWHHPCWPCACASAVPSSAWRTRLRCHGHRRGPCAHPRECCSSGIRMPLAGPTFYLWALVSLPRPDQALKAMGSHPSFCPSPGSSDQAVGPAGPFPAPDFWSQTVHPHPTPTSFVPVQDAPGWPLPLIVCSEASWATSGGKKHQTQDKAPGWCWGQRPCESTRPP